MRHRWLLQALSSQFNVTKVVFRYNYGNITKLDPSDTGHHIECQMKQKHQPNSYTTVVYVGPYFSLDDAQEDMEFMKHEKD